MLGCTLVKILIYACTFGPTATVVTTKGTRVLALK